MSNTRKLPKPTARTAPAVPSCECSHGSGPFDRRPCGRPAYFRATIVCGVRGCTDAAESHLLCEPCVDQWLDSAAANPHSPELRITKL